MRLAAHRGVSKYPPSGVAYLGLTAARLTSMSPLPLKLGKFLTHYPLRISQSRYGVQGV